MVLIKARTAGRADAIGCRRETGQHIGSSRACACRLAAGLCRLILVHSSRHIAHQTHAVRGRCPRSCLKLPRHTVTRHNLAGVLSRVVLERQELTRLANTVRGWSRLHSKSVSSRTYCRIHACCVLTRQRLERSSQAGRANAVRRRRHIHGQALSRWARGSGAAAHLSLQILVLVLRRIACCARGCIFRVRVGPRWTR